MSVDISREQDIPELTDEVVLQLFAAARNTVEIPDDFEWSIALVDDARIAVLNEQYREKVGPTDVLSFRYDDFNGEIVISKDRVLAQAAEYGNTVLEESAWMVVHGILHVLGWDHERSQEEHDEQREE